MADEIPHLAWPYTLGATVDQDTDAELLAAAAVIACTPRGWRDDLPGFGVTNVAFSQGPVDLERLAREIAEGYDGLDFDGDEALDLANATIRTIRLTLDRGPNA